MSRGAQKAALCHPRRRWWDFRFTAAAQAAGLERRVTAHSGRVGLASALTSGGASTTDVMLAGNWKTSRMVTHYSAGATASRLRGTLPVAGVDWSSLRNTTGGSVPARGVRGESAGRWERCGWRSHWRGALPQCCQDWGRLRRTPGDWRGPKGLSSAGGSPGRRPTGGAVKFSGRVGSGLV